MPVRWGIISTANINRHVIPAAGAATRSSGSKLEPVDSYRLQLENFSGAIRG